MTTRGVGTRVTQLFSALLVAVGVAVVVETALLGGGVGFVLGPLFILAGTLRLYLIRRA